LTICISPAVILLPDRRAGKERTYLLH